MLGEVLAFLADPRLLRLEASTDVAHFGRALPVLRQLTNVTHFTLRQDVATVQHSRRRRRRRRPRRHFPGPVAEE